MVISAVESSGVELESSDSRRSVGVSNDATAVSVDMKSLMKSTVITYFSYVHAAPRSTDVRLGARAAAHHERVDNARLDKGRAQLLPD